MLIFSQQRVVYVANNHPNIVGLAYSSDTPCIAHARNRLTTPRGGAHVSRLGLRTYAWARGWRMKLNCSYIRHQEKLCRTAGRFRVLLSTFTCQHSPREKKSPRSQLCMCERQRYPDPALLRSVTICTASVVPHTPARRREARLHRPGRW